MNKIPLTIDKAPFSIAKSRVLVRKACCHSSIIKTPDATKSAAPIKL